jgi:hypothetical protein
MKPFFKLKSISGILFCCLSANCMAKLDLENSGDTTSNAFLVRGLFTDYMASLIRPADNSTTGEVPQYLSALMYRSGQSVGVRIYPVDTETGNLGTYQEYSRTPTAGLSPGNAPKRIVRIPGTKELLVAAGLVDNKLYSLKVTDDGSVSPYQTSTAFSKDVSFVTVSSDGTKIFATSENTASPPDSLIRYVRDASSGGITLQSSGGYPFGLVCGPKSIAVSPSGKNLFINSVSSATGLYGLVDDSGTLTQASGSPVTLTTVVTSNNNLCLHPTKSYLYTTINQASGPIVGYNYGSDSSLSVLPSSPFTPSSSYTNTITTAARTLAIDPLGKYVAFLYQESSTYKLQLLNIDSQTGTLSPTNNPVSVGNSPINLEWDGSGRFLYFVSNDATNYQIEVYRVTQSGTLMKAPNSPFTVTTMAGTGAFPIGLSSISKTSTVKVGEFP